MSIAGGVDRAIGRGASIGCDAIQIFLKSNRQWRGPPLTASQASDFIRQRRATSIAVFAHSSYLINLASPAPLVRRASIAGLVDEIARATALGVPFIVLHPGAHPDEPTGLRLATQGLDEVFAATGGTKVRIALETTAGQGSSLGHRFEQLAAIIARSRHPARLAVCVDTCHLFAAGYDIRTPREYEKIMTELDRIIGYRQVVAFHLNDSLKPFGSRVDRHEHIGRGHLGLPAFRRVLRDPRWRGLPMVLETPKGDDLREDIENLRVLRGLL